MGGSAASALASGGARDSAASSLTGGGVAGSSLSQESLVIAGPVSVASSTSPARGRRSRSRGGGGRLYWRALPLALLSPIPPSGVRILARSIAVPALGLGVTVTCRSGGLQHSRRDSSRSPSARVRSRCSRSRSSGHYWSRDRSPSSDRSRSGKRSWRSGRGHQDRAEAAVASRDHGNPGLTVAPAPAVAGGATTLPTSSFPDLVRLVLSLSGSVEQQGAVLGSLLSAAAVTGAGGVCLLLPRQCQQQPLLLACLRCLLPVGRLLLVQPLRPLRTVDVSVLKSLPAQSGAMGGRLVGRGPARVGSVARVVLLPLLALPIRPVLLPPPPPLSPRSPGGGGGGGASALAPPSASRSGAGGGCSTCAHSASGRTSSPLPGPSGLSSDVRAAPRTDRSHVGLHGLSSPAPSGVAEEDRDSISGSVDSDRDDSFRSVLRLIREFHGLEEPASVASNRCKTSLAPIYGLQSQSSPALHLPLSPLLSSLLEDTNLALARFVEDQTVHGFLPAPDCRHRRYYRTSSSSFPGPYTVPPGLASITLDKVSESKKCSVPLPHSQASSLETMLSSVCEVTSWLDWWLSTCGGFREHLPVEVRGNFERLMLSGSRALEFLGAQGITALGNLVLSHRDSLLVDARYMVPAEEVARLRCADLPPSPGIFLSPLLDSALTKMRAVSNDALVQRMLHPPKIPRKSSAGPSKVGSSSSASAARSGVSPVVSRSQQQAPTTPSSSSSHRGMKRRGTKGKAPFSGTSGGSGRSGG